MHTWEKLRELIRRSLDDIVQADDINAGQIEAIYKLVDIVKDIDEISANEPEESMQASDDERYAESGSEDLIMKMERLMQEAGSEREKEAIRRCIESI